MPVDYCAWNGQLVMSCDDASVMQNPLAGQSHSNLRFLKWEDLASYGVPTGWGGVWVNDAVKTGVGSEPFFVSGFSKGVLHLRNDMDRAVAITVKTGGDDARTVNGTVAATGTLNARSYAKLLLSNRVERAFLGDLETHAFESLTLTATEVRPRRSQNLVGGVTGARRDGTGLTAYFHLSNPPRKADPAFENAFLSSFDSRPRRVHRAVVKPADGDARTLLWAFRASTEPRADVDDPSKPAPFNWMEPSCSRRSTIWGERKRFGISSLRMAA